MSHANTCMPATLEFDGIWKGMKTLFMNEHVLSSINGFGVRIRRIISILSKVSTWTCHFARPFSTIHKQKSAHTRSRKPKYTVWICAIVAHAWGYACCYCCVPIPCLWHYILISRAINTAFSAFWDWHPFQWLLFPLVYVHVHQAMFCLFSDVETITLRHDCVQG